MKKIFLLFFISICSIFSLKGQVNYCDSLSINITNQSLTAVTCSSTTNGLNTFWDSQNWTLTDQLGVSVNISGSSATFSLSNSLSDTNTLCLTSVLSTASSTIVCQNCDTIVWDNINSTWVLLSMNLSCIDSSLIDSTAMCFMIWDPVCGCDSVTYSNDCVAANYAGVTSWNPGACSSVANSWDCDGQGNCNDPGTGNGQYTSLSQCQSNCITPSWDCRINLGGCHDPGTGNGQYSSFTACDTICGIINSFADTDLKEIMVYPNPSKINFTIEMPLGEEFDLSIFDVTGNLVISLDNISGHIIFKNNRLLNGVYFVRLVNEKGIFNKKILIE